MKSQALLATLAALVGCAFAYPRGAMSNVTNPMDALSPHCTSGNYRPKHGDILAQSSVPPYTITVTSPSGAIYSPNRAVTITIQGVETQTLKGFFLQADTTEPSFAGEITCAGYGHKVTFCGRQGVTHSNPTDKPKVECKWTPPDFQVGKVQFTSTILANFSTFWTGVKSNIELNPDPTTMTYEQKSIQMRDNMMRQFQQSASGLMRMFGQQSGPGNSFGNMGNIASMFGMNQGKDQSVNNMFGGGATGQGKNYPYAGFAGGSNGLQNLASAFGQQGQSQGLPNQFQQFFQNAS